MNSEYLNEETLGSITFIGDVFGALLLYEPYSEQTAQIYDVLQTLDSDEAAKEWPYVPEDRALQQLCRIQDALTKSTHEDLIWEYRRLFVGPAPKAAPPWGSVYLDKDQVIFGESTLELRQWMRENGIARTVTNEEPEDHAGIMLIMLSWIAQNKPDALPSFLHMHLLPWILHFLDIVSAETANDFFAAVSQLCKESLEGLADVLNIEVAVPRYYR